MKRIVALALAMTFPASSAFAQEIMDEEHIKAADQYVKCAALWKWTSEVMQAGGKPAAATYMNNMGNGAETAALWILSTSYALSNPDAAPRKVGYWTPYLQPKIDGELDRYRAMAELGTSMEPDLELCTELSKGQAEIIESLRRQYPKGG